MALMTLVCTDLLNKWIVLLSSNISLPISLYLIGISSKFSNVTGFISSSWLKETSEVATSQWKNIVLQCVVAQSIVNH